MSGSSTTTTFTLSWTAPANPPGSEPLLTAETLWKCFALKANDPMPFISIMAACERHSTSPTLVQRTVTLNTPKGPVVMREDVELTEPSHVIFRRPDGSAMTNLISPGENGEVYVVFMVEMTTELKRGTEEYRKLLAMFQKIVKDGLEGTLATSRRLVKEGKI